jgi:hypothetical protein
MKKNHYYMIDIIRLMCVTAIVTFHTNEFSFYLDRNPVEHLFPVLPMAIYARVFPLSGQVIIFLTFFCWGLRLYNFAKITKYLLLFAVGHVLILAAFSTDGTSLVYKLDWDIYPFMMVVFFVCRFLASSRDLIKKIFFCLSLFLLFIPTPVFQSISQWLFVEPGPWLNLVRKSLFGYCTEVGGGAWPIFPWLGLPVGAFLLGHLVTTKNVPLDKWHAFESLLWLPLLLGSFLSLIFKFPASLYNVPIGPGFYCFILNRSPWEFWSYFIFYIFLLRIGFLSLINSKLAGIRLIKWSATLTWNRNFAITYISHLCILIIGSNFMSLYEEYPSTYFLYILSCLIGAEFWARGFLFIFYRKEKG